MVITIIQSVGLFFGLAFLTLCVAVLVHAWTHVFEYEHDEIRISMHWMNEYVTTNQMQWRCAQNTQLLEDLKALLNKTTAKAEAILSQPFTSSKALIAYFEEVNALLEIIEKNAGIEQPSEEELDELEETCACCGCSLEDEEEDEQYEEEEETLFVKATDYMYLAAFYVIMKATGKPSGYQHVLLMHMKYGKFYA